METDKPWGFKVRFQHSSAAYSFGSHSLHWVQVQLQCKKHLCLNSKKKFIWTHWFCLDCSNSHEFFWDLFCLALYSSMKTLLPNWKSFSDKNYPVPSHSSGTRMGSEMHGFVHIQTEQVSTWHTGPCKGQRQSLSEAVVYQLQDSYLCLFQERVKSCISNLTEKIDYFKGFKTFGDTFGRRGGGKWGGNKIKTTITSGWEVI